MKFEDFGRNLALIRQQKNISAYELSLRIEKNVSYIGKVENGKINISLKSIIKICEALNIPISELFIENNKGEK